MSEPGTLRKFTILDALVLLAATAAALRACMLVMDANNRGPESDFSTPGAVLADMRERGFLFVPIHVFYWVEVAGPFLRAWCVALALLRAVPPRPERRRLSRQPGFSAT